MNNALYNQIRIFQSIAREGNISAAARKLEITPPSVSNALKLLEEHIGHPLFVRTTRRIELTETGQLLLEQTAAAVESLENSLESIRDQNQEPSGIVRITLSRFAYHLVERLKDRLNQFFTCSRRGNALGRTIKQANPEPGFQSLQSMTKR